MITQHDQPEHDLVELTWTEGRKPNSIPVALIWSAIGGALGGVLVHITLAALTTAADLVAGAAPTFDQVFATLVLWPLMVGGVSLVVVVPCTLLFGLPSALAVRHLALRRWPALATIVASAVCAEFGALWLIWGRIPTLAGFLFATPFTASAAMILWWRLSPSA